MSQSPSLSLHRPATSRPSLTSSHTHSLPSSLSRSTSTPISHPPLPPLPPQRLCHVEVRLPSSAGRAAFSEFDFSFFNRTRFAGLENDAANAYCNAVLQARGDVMTWHVVPCHAMGCLSSHTATPCCRRGGVAWHALVVMTLSPFCFDHHPPSTPTHTVLPYTLSRSHQPPPHPHPPTPGALLHPVSLLPPPRLPAHALPRRIPHRRARLPLPHAPHLAPRLPLPGRQLRGSAAAEPGSHRAGAAGEPSQGHGGDHR